MGSVVHDCNFNLENVVHDCSLDLGSVVHDCSLDLGSIVHDCHLDLGRVGQACNLRVTENIEVPVRVPFLPSKNGEYVTHKSMWISLRQTSLIPNTRAAYRLQFV